MSKQFLSLIACFFLFSQSFAQDKDPLPRFSIRGSCAIPKIIGPEAFRISFLGVYDAGLTLNLRVGKSVTVGVGYKNAMFNITSFFKAKDLSTKLYVHDAVVRLGYDYISGPKSFISISLNSGYGIGQYQAVKAAKDSLNGKYPTQFGSIFLRPEFSANFLVEDNFAFGVYLAYNMMLNSYDPKLNTFDTYENFSQYKNKANMGWISFGFNFYFGPGKKTTN
jgi:hypothetical protein